jgi:hypothetical protein
MVTWTAIQKQSRLRFDLQMRGKAATMTIDVTDTEATIQENTFFGHEELNNVLALLNTDLNQQAVSSTPTAGTSPASTQSLAPQDLVGTYGTINGPYGTLVNNHCPLVDPNVKCSTQTKDRDNLNGKVSADCSPDCPTSGFGRLVGTYDLGSALAYLVGVPDHCSNCMKDLSARGDAQSALDRCVDDANMCLRKQQWYDYCVNNLDQGNEYCCDHVADGANKTSDYTCEI